MWKFCLTYLRPRLYYNINASERKNNEWMNNYCMNIDTIISIFRACSFSGKYPSRSCADLNVHIFCMCLIPCTNHRWNSTILQDHLSYIYDHNILIKYQDIFQLKGPKKEKFTKIFLHILFKKMKHQIVRPRVCKISKDSGTVSRNGRSEYRHGAKKRC